MNNFEFSSACMTVAILSCKHVKTHYAFTSQAEAFKLPKPGFLYVLEQH